MRLTSRPGFALPVAIGSMVVIGMLIAGVFFTATQENRVGGNTINQERAFRSAERGLNHVYGNWKNVTMNAMAIGATTRFSYDSMATKGFTDTVQVTRLNSNTYWLLSTGVAGSLAEITAGRAIGAARHRTGMIVRVSPLTINFLGALTLRGDVAIGGSSFTSGADHPPSDWQCPPAGTTQPGLATSSINNIDLNGCKAFSCIDGAPSVLVTSAVNDTNTYFTYNDGATWSTITGAASLRFSGDQTFTSILPSTSSGDCNTADLANWGDPNRADPAGPCESYFPIVYFAGTTANTVHIVGGVGQGILLIDGNLIVDGGFTWYGPVIVRGTLTTQGTGAHFNGGVMAYDANLNDNTVLGSAVINYSGCANAAATSANALVRRMAVRSWAEMF